MYRIDETIIHLWTKGKIFLIAENAEIAEEVLNKDIRDKGGYFDPKNRFHPPYPY